MNAITDWSAGPALVDQAVRLQESESVQPKGLRSDATVKSWAADQAAMRVRAIRLSSPDNCRMIARTLQARRDARF